jgi:acetylornithine deacetylase/succinyl-diaminopimelate desuccinylase-like protein
MRVACGSVARWALLLIVGVGVGSLAAQERAADPIQEVAGRPAVRAALAAVNRSEGRTVATLIELASIVSPSGREHQRAAAVARRMREIGLTRVAVDSTPNVVGTIPGTSGRAIVFVTMLDDLPIIESFQREGRRPAREGSRVVGPAVELQSSVAAMLTAAEALLQGGVRPRHDLVFAGVAREETGLQGMAALYAQLKDRAVGFVEILGDGHRIQYGARGATAWWRIVARGPEGHTRNGGLPNVNQAIARAVDAIFALPHPERYRDRQTAINVGTIQSGIASPMRPIAAFNYKPPTGWFSLDVRSSDRAIVEEIGQEVDAILRRVRSETSISLDMVPEFQSLGGQIPGARDSLLTRTATAVSRYFGYEPELSDSGCCNMRVPISHGTLAIGLHGRERGGSRATLDEWADIPNMMSTARHVTLLAAAAGGAR